MGEIKIRSIMKRCLAGTISRQDSNDLHAECYGTIGALWGAVEMMRDYLQRPTQRKRNELMTMLQRFDDE
jgi:hypothetical protein